MSENHYQMCRVIRASTHEWRSDAQISQIAELDRPRVTELIEQAVRRKILHRSGTTSCLSTGRDRVTGIYGLIEERLRIVGAARPNDLRATIHFDADTALAHGLRIGAVRRCRSRLEAYYWLTANGDPSADGQPPIPAGVEIKRSGTDRAAMWIGDQWALDACLDHDREAWQVRKAAPAINIPTARVPFLGVLAMQLRALNPTHAAEMAHV
jgi:hypothetical protein